MQLITYWIPANNVFGPSIRTRPLLTCGSSPQHVVNSCLQARALWLRFCKVGKKSGSTSPNLHATVQCALLFTATCGSAGFASATTQSMGTLSQKEAKLLYAASGEQAPTSFVIMRLGVEGFI